MDSDRRDPRDWPEPGGSDRSGDDPIDDATRPNASPPVSDSTWPTQDATAETRPPSTDRDPEQTQPWPTEPPTAGSGGADTWPTSAPERDAELGADRDEAGWPSAADADAPGGSTEADWPADVRSDDAEDTRVDAPPPGEIEAYPAESTFLNDADRAEPPPAETEGGMAPASAATIAGTAAHGVPDAQGSVGESTLCPRCGTENRPGLSFCRNCGQRLVAAGVSTTVERPGAPDGTQSCPRCGTHNRSGVAFCQNCGANLRGTAAGYVPPAVAEEGADVVVADERRGAVLGPVVLLIGVVGLITGYLLPFLGGESLFDRAFGSGGYGAAFWSGYPEIEAGIADQAYFGLAAPVPLLALSLAALAVAGFARARPGGLQKLGLIVALTWSVGLIVLFLLVELAGGLGGDIVGILRGLTPAGIILFLASLIVLIGVLTRFGRS
jgi:Double zinc ribbon